MKSLFDLNAKDEILNRIQQLKTNTVPKWGQMTVGQMCAHCQLPLEIAIQKRELNMRKIGFLKKFMFKLYKPMMYNDKAWKQNLPTVSSFRIKDGKKLHQERERLIDIVNEFHKRKGTVEWPKHPLFGNFTETQWGQMQYKHLDHHLKQFGC